MKSKAFTLIETLSVCGTIGILTGIILPTISRVRATARNTECQNNIRQFGLMLETERGNNKYLNYPRYDMQTDYLDAIQNFTNIPKPEMEIITYEKKKPYSCQLDNKPEQWFNVAQGTSYLYHFQCPQSQYALRQEQLTRVSPRVPLLTEHGSFHDGKRNKYYDSGGVKLE